MFELFAHFMYLGVTAEELEAAYVEFVMDHSYKKSAAYSLLDLNRKTVASKLKRPELNLEP